MRVLLTGASGFLGRPCLALLMARGHEVLALSRRSPPPGLVAAVRWHVADLNADDSYAAAVKAFEPEAALHLAWEGIPDYSLDTSLRNLRSGCVLADVLFAAGCRHIAVSGSCWEYGKVSGPVRESTEPVAPSIFGASKTAQRLVLEALARACGATLAWGRVFYPYGPGQKAASLAPALCGAVLAGETPAIRTPAAVNDFVFVDDVAEALVVLAETSVTGTFNIGSGGGTAVGEIADRLLALAGRAPEFASQPAAGGEPAGFWADNTALRSLGWQPRTPLDAGLRRTLDFFREHPASC